MVMIKRPCEGIRERWELLEKLFNENQFGGFNIEPNCSRTCRYFQ